MKNLSTFEPQIEQHYFYRKRQVLSHVKWTGESDRDGARGNPGVCTQENGD